MRAMVNWSQIWPWLLALFAAPLACLGLIAGTARLLKSWYRDPDILKERRWPEDFWRHSRFRKR